jgi:hypothetical protein
MWAAKALPGCARSRAEILAIADLEAAGASPAMASAAQQRKTRAAVPTVNRLVAVSGLL